jgi:DNA-binding transcriptional regulator GbsR (MarR family)
MSAANHKPLTTEASLPMNNMHEYVESFGLYWEQAGLPRMAGRILSWLLICDPPHQTMHELTEALQASKSSISTGTRMLIQMGIIERLSKPGQRRDHYRVVPDSWSHIMEEKAKKQFTELRRLSERGLALLDAASPARRQRLEEMRDYYVFMEREFPLILDHWRAHRSAQLQPQRNSTGAGSTTSQTPSKSDGQGAQ